MFFCVVAVYSNVCFNFSCHRVSVTQGRFKRPVDADGLCMGQEFLKAGNVPPWVGEMVLTAAAKVFSSSTQVDIYARLPYFMNPVLAACQMVNVSRPGEEPQLTEAEEDMRLFSADLADKQGECCASLYQPCIQQTSSPSELSLYVCLVAQQ